MNEPTPETIEFNRQALGVIANLFHGSYCEHNNLVGEAKAAAQAAPFYAWAVAAMDAADGYEVAASMNTTYAVWERARELVEKSMPTGGSPVWWEMVLADRSKPKLGPATVCLSTLITWPDGCVSSTTMHLRAPDEPGLSGMTDPLLASAIAKIAPAMLGSVFVRGLDGLHGDAAKAGDYTDGHGGTGFNEFKTAVYAAMRYDPKTPKAEWKPGQHYLALLESLLFPPPKDTATMPITGGWTG